jgi:hypothetical protein
MWSDVWAARSRFVHLLPVPFHRLRTDCFTEGDVVLGYKQIAQAVDEAGRIVVKFRRGRFGGKIRESSEPRAFDPLDNVDDTKSCKEVVCKHNVSHVTTYGQPKASRICSSPLTKARHVPLRPAPEAAPPGPGAYEREWIRADEPEGKPIVFTIRYRSRGRFYLAHYPWSCTDSNAAALVALGIKNDVVDAPSLSGIDDSTDMDLTSIYRATASASPGPLPNPLVIKTSDFQASLDSHSGETHESQECIDDEDSEEDNSSDATIVADGEKSDFDSDPRTGKDAILVSDDEEHIEGNNSGRVPSNRDDPILVTDDKDSDLLKSLERSVEPRQATPVYNADESNPSQSSERPSEPTRPGTPTQSEESARLFAIQNRVKTPFSKTKRRYVPDRAKAVTAVKRKINDGQLEDFFSSKRLTLADATDV